MRNAGEATAVIKLEGKATQADPSTIGHVASPQQH